MNTECLTIAGVNFQSRLIAGTGKFSSAEVARKALAASGTQMVTVAVRRVDLDDRAGDPVLAGVDFDAYRILPNTAGCTTAAEAMRAARLGREAGLSEWVKLEVIGDPVTLFPDNEALLEATRDLVRDGFVVLPYTNDDLVSAKKLRDAGAAAVMPLGAPIGSGLGVQNRVNLRILIEQITDVPIIVDAGVGTPSDAAIVMEMGADGVLMNTGIAAATDPIRMATAMRRAVEAGRLGFEAGRIPRRLYASASSPEEGVVK
jgi:thiazole synthase